MLASAGHAPLSWASVARRSGRPAAAALDMPRSLHGATRRQGKIRGAGPGTLRDASSRATKAFYPALSLCDMIFSGVFERNPRRQEPGPIYPPLLPPKGGPSFRWGSIQYYPLSRTVLLSGGRSLIVQLRETPATKVTRL